MWERALAAGIVLNGKYRIDKVIGEGNFGITYLGSSTAGNVRVAIKEYYPISLAKRDMTGKSNSLMVLSGQCMPLYSKGVKRFAKEARAIAAANPSDGVARVRDLFYENNTAYMVMDYVEGIKLKNYLERNRLSAENCLNLFRPVVTALESIHNQGVLHRDINPDNLILTPDNRLVLVDFGAGRILGCNDEQSLAATLTPGYAPIEEYCNHSPQGPWTDIYSLCASMLNSISGVTLPVATSRMNADGFDDAIDNLPIDDEIKSALKKGLSVSADDRYDSMTEFYEYLYEGKKPNDLVKILIAVMIVLVLAAAIIGGLIGWKTIKNRDAEDEDEIVEESSETYVDIDEIMGESTEDSSDETATEVVTEENSTDSTTEAVTEDGSVTEDDLRSVFSKNGQDVEAKSISDDFDGDGKIEMFILGKAADEADNSQSVFRMWFVSKDSCEMQGAIEAKDKYRNEVELGILQFENSKMAYAVNKNYPAEDSVKGGEKCETRIYSVNDGKVDNVYTLANSSIRVTGEQIYVMVDTDDNCKRTGNQNGPKLAYPLICKDGKLVEKASVKVGNVVFKAIEDWDQKKEEIENKLLNGEIEEVSWQEAGKLKGTKIVDVFYNDNGHLYINYEVTVAEESDKKDSKAGKKESKDDSQILYAQVDITLSGHKIQEYHCYGGQRRLSGILNKDVGTEESDNLNMWNN